MKDYEEKVINIMDGVKDNIRTQLKKAYICGYEQGYEDGKKVPCNCKDNYQEQQKQDTIQVGDEVDYHGDKYVVTLIANGDNTYTAISDDGSHILRATRDDITATGRHFPQIAEVLAEMRGESE